MSSGPQCKFRIGAVTATVWLNKPDGDRRPFHTLNLQRRYKDGEDTKYSDSFSLGDLANLQRVLVKAQDYIEAKEAKLKME